jgi:DNA-binding beta-propeller fold protein YncE
MKRVCWVWILACSCCDLGSARELVIDVVAGTGAAENNGDAGPARTINIGDPFGVEIGPDGALYVTEVRHHRVRRVDLKTGEITTVAGCGRRGYAGDGGLAVNAELNEPYEVRFDRDGNMFFVEMKNHLVRRVDRKTQIITTITGTGRPGYGGDGGPAAKAQFREPHSIAFDATGALYIADIGNHRIRRIDPKSGIVETIAGNGERALPKDGWAALGNPILGPRALFIDGSTLWIALREGHSVWRMDLGDGVLHHVAGAGDVGYSGDGGSARQARFNGPKGIAVDQRGEVFVVDTENHAIRRIDVRSNQVSTIAGGGPRATEDADDRGAAATTTLNRPHGVCVGPDGAVYVGDTLNHRVLRIK